MAAVRKGRLTDFGPSSMIAGPSQTMWAEARAIQVGPSRSSHGIRGEFPQLNRVRARMIAGR
jgi:hypothetical protein